jgi:hypothetical protein
MHSQNTHRFVLRILSIRTDSFYIFSVYQQIHSVSPAHTHSKIPLKGLPFYVCALYMYRYIPRILSVQTDPFRMFLVYVQIHSVNFEEWPK